MAKHDAALAGGPDARPPAAIDGIRYLTEVDRDLAFRLARQLRLRPGPAALLVCLMRRAGRTVSDDQLRLVALGPDADDAGTIPDALARLRRAVPGLSIRVAEGLGYTMTPAEAQRIMRLLDVPPPGPEFRAEAVRRLGLRANAGAPWSRLDDAILLAWLHRGHPLAPLASGLGRDEPEVAARADALRARTTELPR